MVIAAAGIVLIWARFVGLDQSLWSDEVYTVQQFVSRGPVAILAGPYNTNNHMFFSLLAWLAASVLGATESVYRLPSVVPGVLAVAVLGAWAWFRLGPWPAAFFAVLATALPLHMQLTPQARGYGLAFLAMAAMLVAADHFARSGEPRSLVAMGLAALIGIWTLPVFGLAFVGQVVPLFFLRRGRRRQLLAVTGGVIAGSLLLYSGVLDDLFVASGQQYGIRLAWHAAVTGPLEFFALPLAALLATGSPKPSAGFELPAALVVVALVAIGAAGLVHRMNTATLLILVSPVAVAFFALTTSPLFVTGRFVSYLALPLLILVACGLAEAGRQLVRFRAPQALVALAGALLALYSVCLVGDYSARQALVPRENFKEVAQVVRGSGIARVVTNTRPRQVRLLRGRLVGARLASMWYYLGGRRAVTALPDDRLRAVFCSRGEPLIYVEEPPHPIDTSCLTARGAAHVVVPQDRFGKFVVWIVPK